MFKQKNRLVPGIRFNKSYIFAAPQFILKEKKNGLDINRFGVVVSKKIDRRAVTRNKIKRFFRASLVELDKKMDKGHDILIVIKRGILGKTDRENELTIENVLSRAGFI